MKRAAYSKAPARRPLSDFHADVLTLWDVLDVLGVSYWTWKRRKHDYKFSEMKPKTHPPTFRKADVARYLGLRAEAR